MKRILFPLVIFALLTPACASFTFTSPVISSPTKVSSTPNPDYTQEVNSATPRDLAPAPDSSGLLPADEPNTYWVVNPSGGSRLFVSVTYPRGWNGELLPTLVLVPGGVGISEPRKAQALATEGLLVIIFDPEGRGHSEGKEDYNGFIGQDGLAAVIEAATALPGLDADRYGLVSFSYGVTMAVGALARHPDLPIDFYIDWEGPVNRMYTTTGCGSQALEHIQWESCEDDAWWAEREAMNFIADVQVPYQRIQSQNDHVQRDNAHAIDIVNAAVAGGVPWTRLNEYPAGQTYEPSNPPAMLSDALDKQLEKTVAAYAWYIIENVL